MPVYEIELTPEEIEAALLEARKKKWFHLQHADYWAMLERSTRQSSRESQAQKHRAKDQSTPAELRPSE